MKYLVTISAILLTFLQTACDPAKRAAKQQKHYQQLVDEYIKNHPPRIDTVAKYLPGKDSTEFFKRIADSIAATKIEKVVDVRIKYKDTCTTAIDTYNEGFELGYKVGFHEGKAKAPVRVDTFVKNIVPVDQIEFWKRQADQWKEKYYQVSVIVEQQKKKTNTWFWWFIAASLSTVGLTILTLKKLFRP